MREEGLYEPVKLFLEDQGYEVKGEVLDCDVVATKGDVVVVVELKLNFNLTLVLQGIERQKITDYVYLAVPRGKRPARSRRLRQLVGLCRRLGLGLLFVGGQGQTRGVEISCEPGPYQPRKNVKRRDLLLEEFNRRTGDHNIGGSTGQPIVTAYKEDALRLARQLEADGPSQVKYLRETLDNVRAGRVLQDNYYGWFVRVKRGVYSLSDEGKKSLETYREIVETWEDPKGRDES